MKYGQLLPEKYQKKTRPIFKHFMVFNMKNSPLSGLIIRTAIVRNRYIGYIYACDLEKERNDIPHTITFKWESGNFHQGNNDYNAHSVCIAETPLTCLLSLSEEGYYSIITAAGNYLGNIPDDSSPAPDKPRFYGFRSLSSVDGMAYAVGLRGMVYRMDEMQKWTRIDDYLPETFDIQALDGFDGSNLFAVGWNGELWRYTDSSWLKEELPTNENLTAVKCGGDGNVYIAGHNGMLLYGRPGIWEVIENECFDSDIWDLEWFENRLYISTLSGVYVLKGSDIEKVEFSDDKPKSYYQLSTADNVLWSNGEYDIFSYDGIKWTRIV
jgi:hypothetical protein